MPTGNSRSKSKGSPEKDSAPKTKDVPRGGFTCASYEDGHNVHYVAALKVVPDRTPVSANIDVVDGVIRLKIGSEASEVHSHNPSAFELLIMDIGRKCLWYPEEHLVCWTQNGVRHWASVSLAPVSECFSSDEFRLGEYRMWS